MAAAEHPLKKRKLYEPFPDHHPGFAPPLPPPPLLQPPLPPPLLQPPLPPPLPHPYHYPGFAPQPPPPPPPPPTPALVPEEIIRRRRNKEEIRNIHECYRRIKFCASQKDPRLMPDIEQAYLSLIAASRGCTSVQRVVAELIPRYASHCPTALEAAAKVSINMYGWSLGVIMRGEDVDGVAYQTAKACIFGLVDICCTASQEAPTSSVIQVICAAVFINVLTFFTSSFEGQDIYHIGSQEILKLQEPLEFFNLKQENSDDNSPILQKLLKFRALCLLRIFFSFPKDLLTACFELLASRVDTDLYKRGVYFLSQVTSHLNADDVSKSLNEIRDAEGPAEVKPVSNADKVPDKSPSLLDNCFMGKREVCRLLPSTANDQKGVHDFMSYLKQRECAGVIKIPAGKSLWARLLFILPPTPEICSLFAIPQHPAEYLLALVLPKETNVELP